MEMNVILKQDQENKLRFSAENSKGLKAVIDGSNSPEGMRPMELLISSMIGCAALDLVHILKKQRQELMDMEVLASGVRPDGGAPKPFTSISVTFRLYGNLDKDKAERAAQLSIEKYCSVRTSLDPQIEITHKTEIINNL